VKTQFTVSAIVSTYNAEKFIRACLQDLIAQTLYKKGELEIIVIDSASPQNEKSIVEEFQRTHPNIVYERTAERETIYAAWNRAIKMARGHYITNANTDDRRRSEGLEVMANYLDSYSDVCLVYADQLITTVANETFANTKAERRWNWPPYSYEELRSRCCVGSQPMWRKSLHETYGEFRSEFHCAGDYEFWLRIGSQGEKMMLIPQILGLYYLNPQGVEHSAPRRAVEETHLVWEQYGIPFAPIPEGFETEPQSISVESLGVVLTDTEQAQVRPQNNSNSHF
jgi:glycosyltransferase involved in cell wall biosynthesis